MNLLNLARAATWAQHVLNGDFIEAPGYGSTFLQFPAGILQSQLDSLCDTLNPYTHSHGVHIHWEAGELRTGRFTP